MKRPRVSFLQIWVLFAALLAHAGQSGAPSSSAQLPPQHLVYEGVVGLQGKTIGTNILLDVQDPGPGDSGVRRVSGWIQRNDFFPIDSGQMNPERIEFTSGGNQYTINLRTGRINYSGRDGNGNQRVEKMSPVRGRVYKLTEETEDEQRRITLQTDDGEREYIIGSPAIWKRQGLPIDRFNRLEELLGKTVDAWLARIGATKYVAVIEEPEGLDLQKKAPRKDKKKK